MLFFLILLLRGCTSKFDLIASDFSIEKLKKQSSTQKARVNFEVLLSKTSGAIKLVQGACMMITLSMWLYSIV